MSAVHPNECDYRLLPLDEAESPVKGGAFEHHVDRWWIVHPDKGLAFWNPVSERGGRRRHESLGAPLCNPFEKIQRDMAETLAQKAGWPAQARFVHSAWAPIIISGYL